MLTLSCFSALTMFDSFCPCCFMVIVLAPSCSGYERMGRFNSNCKNCGLAKQACQGERAGDSGEMEHFFFFAHPPSFSPIPSCDVSVLLRTPHCITPSSRSSYLFVSSCVCRDSRLVRGKPGGCGQERGPREGTPHLANTLVLPRLVNTLVV